jgi:uncharacterized protein YjhX (UPF0386 family)
VGIAPFFNRDEWILTDLGYRRYFYLKKKREQERDQGDPGRDKAV